VIDPTPLRRFVIAVGKARYEFERRHGRASAKALAIHPDSLARVNQLGALCYRGNSRPWPDVVGLPLVPDAGVPPGTVEARGAVDW
jgi:hypothetical protein